MYSVTIYLFFEHFLIVVNKSAGIVVQFVGTEHGAYIYVHPCDHHHWVWWVGPGGLCHELRSCRGMQRCACGCGLLSVQRLCVVAVCRGWYAGARRRVVSHAVPIKLPCLPCLDPVGWQHVACVRRLARCCLPAISPLQLSTSRLATFCTIT